MEVDKMAYSPKLVLLFAGKRKSGKDFVTESLARRLGSEPGFDAGSDLAVVHISAPIKLEYARRHGLDYEELLGSSAYKERHRAAMLEWSEDLRRRDHGCFIRPAVAMVDPLGTKKIWIVADVRRKTDLRWFRENCDRDEGRRVRTILVKASEDTRGKRGWVFVPGIDDAETECGLDDVGDWDLVLRNDGDEALLERSLDVIVGWCLAAKGED